MKYLGDWIQVASEDLSRTGRVIAAHCVVNYMLIFNCTHLDYLEAQSHKLSTKYVLDLLYRFKILDPCLPSESTIT